MWLWHGWGWQPLQTASPIHFRNLQRVWAHSYAVHQHMVGAIHSYTHPTWLRFWDSVSCGVKMMWLCHGWGWQPPQTASPIHITHVQHVWAHWHAVHWHTAAALQRFTHTTWIRFWGSGSLLEAKWCHYIMVEAEDHLKLLPTSTLDIYKVFEHIDMLSIIIQQQPYTVIPILLGSDFGVLCHL